MQEKTQINKNPKAQLPGSKIFLNIFLWVVVEHVLLFHA